MNIPAVRSSGVVNLYPPRLCARHRQRGGLTLTPAELGGEK